MPTYEYRCTKGHTFDVFQSMSDDPVSVCEVCGRPVARGIVPPLDVVLRDGSRVALVGPRLVPPELVAS